MHFPALCSVPESCCGWRQWSGLLPSSDLGSVILALSSSCRSALLLPVTDRDFWWRCKGIVKIRELFCIRVFMKIWKWDYTEAITGELLVFSEYKTQCEKASRGWVQSAKCFLFLQQTFSTSPSSQIMLFYKISFGFCL